MIYFVVKSIPHVSVFSFSSFQLKLKWKSTIRPGVSSFHLTDKGYQFKQFINTQEYINLSMSQTKMRGKLPNKCLASPPIFLHLFPTVKQNKFSFFRHCFLHDSHPTQLFIKSLFLKRSFSKHKSKIWPVTYAFSNFCSVVWTEII